MSEKGQEGQEVSMQDAADNMILLDEAVAERIVDVFCSIMYNDKFPSLRQKLLNAFKAGQEIEEKQRRYEWDRQRAQYMSNMRMGIANNDINQIYGQNQTYMEYVQKQQEAQRQYEEAKAKQETLDRLNSIKTLDKFKHIFGL